MTICFVSDSYPFARPYGGIAIYTQTAAKALAARGHTVHVLIGHRGPANDQMDGAIHVHYRPVTWLPVIGEIVPALGESWGLANALRKLHRVHRFDLVEFPNFEGVGLMTEVMRLMPVVVRLHTSMVESVEVQNRPANRGERFMIWAERQSARLANGVVTHSIAHRDRLAEMYGLEKVHVIPHGIVLPPKRVLDTSNPNILTLGRLNARKGGPTLLEAMPLVINAFPNARWTNVGAAETHPLVQQFRAAHPSIPQDRAVFHEFLEISELEAMYAEASVYCSASVYESFGLTFVEAMARSIPVVGCATSSMNEIISHEETGLLVPPSDGRALADATIRLLQDPELGRRMGERGREVAEAKYTADRMAAEIEAWYESVLNRS